MNCGTYHSWFIWSLACNEAIDRNGSSDDVDVQTNIIDPQAEDQELKGQLLRKYRGYLGSLKQEFTKKRKKGKLPKEARQQLLEWWSRHYKWPYPSVCCIYNMILKPIYNCLVNFMNLSSIGDIYRSITIMVKDYFGIHFYLEVFFSR